MPSQLSVQGPQEPALSVARLLLLRRRLQNEVQLTSDCTYRKVLNPARLGHLVFVAELALPAGSSVRGLQMRES